MDKYALDRMRSSLEGLSVGDAFGQRFFFPEIVQGYLAGRTTPPAPWHWTDDTNMALSIVQVLISHSTIDQDALARSFGDHYDPQRGYGRAMHSLLPMYSAGADWRTEAPTLFRGAGSYGNGAAMRVAPLGAFFSNDLDRTVEEAHRSAVVTHTHPEGVAGAIAVAVAAASAASGADPAELVETVLVHTPESEVRDRLDLIHRIGPDSSVWSVVTLLGNGSHITAQDTVAFTVWAAAQHLDDFESALWLTATAQGDVDTTCAIVGGIVGGRVGIEAIPHNWRIRREPLPDWVPAG